MPALRWAAPRVQKLHRAGAVLAGDGQPRGGVAHFHGQGDMAARGHVAALEMQRASRPGFRRARRWRRLRLPAARRASARMAVTAKPLASRVTGNRPSGRRCRARTRWRRHSAGRRRARPGSCRPRCRRSASRAPARRRSCNRPSAAAAAARSPGQGMGFSSLAMRAASPSFSKPVGAWRRRWE